MQLEKCEEVVDKLIIDSAGNDLSEITKRKMLSICSSKVKDLVSQIFHLPNRHCMAMSWQLKGDALSASSKLVWCRITAGAERDPSSGEKERWSFVGQNTGRSPREDLCATICSGSSQRKCGNSSRHMHVAHAHACASKSCYDITSLTD